MNEAAEWEAIKNQLVNGLDELFGEIMSLDHKDNWDEFVADAKVRYKIGREQHAGSVSTWDGWHIEDFDRNIREELIDCVIYAAARIVRETR